MRRSGGRLSAALLAAALTVAGVTLGGCTAARNSLDTGVSRCFRVLPVARADVGSSGLFLGVLWSPGKAVVDAVSKELQGAPPAPPVPPALVAAENHMTCLVAFKGSFAASQVQDGWAPLPGPALTAVVVVRQSDAQILATVLFHRIPGQLDFFHPSAFVH